MAAGLTWQQARALARAGHGVRVPEWRKWLVFDPTYLFFLEIYLPLTGTVTRHVVRAEEFGRAEFLSQLWTDEPWPGGPPGGGTTGIPQIELSLTAGEPTMLDAGTRIVRTVKVRPLTLNVKITGGPHPGVNIVTLRGVWMAPGSLPFDGYRLLTPEQFGTIVSGQEKSVAAGYWVDTPGAVVTATVPYYAGTIRATAQTTCTFPSAS